MTTELTTDLGVSDTPTVPSVSVVGDGTLIRVHRPSAGHTFAFNVGDGFDPEILASCLRGALADAFHAGVAEPRPSLLARKIAEADAARAGDAG
jgi:hypothetical protein